MIVFLFVFLCKSEDGYTRAKRLLEEYIPTGQNDEKAENNLNRMSYIFNYHPPNYKQAEKLYNANKKAIFEKVGRYILKDLGIDDQVRINDLTRYTSKNIRVFAYTIVVMENNFPSELAIIKDQFFTNFVSDQPNNNENEKDFNYFFPNYDEFF